MTKNKISPITHGNELSGQNRIVHFYSILNNNYSQSLKRVAK